MNFIYFGSFRISADILEHLIARGFMPTTVICSPDKPAGRKKLITAPDIKKLIIEKQWPIKILQPEKLKIENLKLEIGASDLAIVMGYPHIIPQAILDLPRLGTVGVHPSLLPKYRGPSPIQTVLLNGDKETGVTLYQIDEKMDHGNILAQSTHTIAPGTDNLTLEQELADLSVNMIIETMPKYLSGKVKPAEQEHASATVTKKFTSADGQVDFINDEPLTVYRKIKSFYPEPSVWTMNLPGYEGKRVKLLAAEWRDNKIHITNIHVEGKKPVRIA